MRPACVACIESVGDIVAFARESGRRIQRFREPEIEHLDGAVVAYFDVRRFEIAMDDALVVRDFERFGNLASDRQRFVDRNRAGREAIGQRGAADELHDERHSGARIFHAVDRRDVRMVQRREQLRFAMKARQALRVAGDFRQQHFDRDVAVELRVARAVHLAHAACPEQRLNLIPAEPRSNAQRHGIVEGPAPSSDTISYAPRRLPDWRDICRVARLYGLRIPRLLTEWGLGSRG